MQTDAPQSGTQIVTEPRKLVRIGELLTTAGVVTQEQLREGLRRAAETDMPLGKILVWSGYVTDEIMRSAVQVQCLLNDHAIDLADAATWLAQEAGTQPARVRKEGGKPMVLESEGSISRLGELLVESELVEESVLEEALVDSKATSLPLGRILSYTKNVPERYIGAALDAQTAIRTGRVNREAALDALRRVKDHGYSFEKALTELGFPPNANEITQFLSVLRAAAVLSEPKLVTAQELALVKGKPLPDVLVEFRFLPDRVVKATVKACSDMLDGSISLSKAIALVKRTVENDFEENNTPTMLRPDTAVSAADLLKLARLMDPGQIKSITPDVLHAFSVTNAKTENVDKTLTIALKCVDLIDRKLLTLEQAIVVLHYCCRKSLSLAVVLELLGVEETDYHE